ncbi:nicotianamine synthase family protein [Wukongibacter sp. M2B1]|uniref:nicotianamine synthase family protein n=1 Tax=Wukongibacter sp. M2B1 TaxID=3088895 RepID=UPI003D7A2E41
MKNKYEFLLSLKMLQYEINELMVYSKECSECFELLRNKLDYLCEFMNCQDNAKQWELWGKHSEIKEYCEKLRETSVKALCDVEKYQSICACNNKLDTSDYMKLLSNSVKYEFETFCVDSKSKVVFIGSGAFPISAMAIAKEIGAEVLCLDIDLEAIELARDVTKVLGLESTVRFSSKTVDELSFVNEATHIIIASLVEDKYKILDDLKNKVAPNTKIILRYGNGLKEIFNYPLEKDLSKEWNQTKISKSESIYDTIVLERTLYEYS